MPLIFSAKPLDFLQTLSSQTPVIAPPPFQSAHWTLLASRTVVTRQWHIAILLCTLDIVCFAVSCNSAIGGAPGAREQQETCESRKHLMCKNNKRPPVERRKYFNFTPLNKILYSGEARLFSQTKKYNLWQNNPTRRRKCQELFP